MHYGRHISHRADFGRRGYGNLEVVPTLFLGNHQVYTDAGASTAGAEMEEEPQLCEWIQYWCEIYAAAYANIKPVVEQWHGVFILVYSSVQ